MKACSVVVRSVTKTYRRGQRRVTALRDVSFALSQGELALLVGPSGSGKTTLLNLIAALDRPDCADNNLAAIGAVQCRDKIEQSCLA